MATIKLHKDFLKNELHLPKAAITNKLTGNDRWSIHHEIIFLHDNKFYKTYYSIGATEYQCEEPWENDNDIECFEVHLVEKLIKVWEII